ncbi:MAG: 50S ribosome-binding GTPase, partial [Dehalococcoidia bacterium]|nr:50S ribosome-binding GTPase [Dehalococcoidia bacterium]
MPANLTPQYYQAERAFRSATTLEEKIEALEGMLSVMPKHKGTDRLRAELTSKIARLKEQLEKTPQGARRRGSYHVKKEGAGQIALVGLTNSGKSALVAGLTGVPLRTADYPYVTREPSPAMMRYENVQIQLVDMPAVDYDEARPCLSSVLRNADVLLVTVDLGHDPLVGLQDTLKALHKLRIALENDPEPYSGILT